MAYLGLHALQHRGQESPGSLQFRWPHFAGPQSHGFGRRYLHGRCSCETPGTLAIGHTRYSTAGDSALLNAQPILVESNKGDRTSAQWEPGERD